MRTAFACAVAALLLGSQAHAQSLGGLAAQEKARREREKEKKAKPAKVYTDEDLAVEAARAGPRDETPPPSPGSSSSEAANASRAVESESEPGEDSPIKGRIAEAQAGLESARRDASAANGEVERLKQDLNPMSTTFKTDPYEIQRLQAALTEAQAKAAEVHKQVGAAEAAMEAVRDEARRAGVRVP